MKLPFHLKRQDWTHAGLLAATVIVVSLRGLLCRDMDTPDSSMHFMDGYFFRDLLRDHPHAHLKQYALHYYQQYPALGFVFWPPLFSFILGLYLLALGPDMLAARLCILSFSLLFALSFYAVLRWYCSPTLAVIAAAAAIAVPGITRPMNQLMLELPAIAAMCLAVACYKTFVARIHVSASLWQAIACGLCCAAVIYIKQPAWFLYAALAADLLTQHRSALRSRYLWIATATVVLASLPLVAFTLTAGRANLSQSVGHATSSIMSGYQPLSRGSLAAWLFYPRLAISALDPVIVLLTCAALLLMTVRARFLRDNILWVAWFFLAYLTFSFYDNRQARFGAFWWPAWIALAASLLAFAMRRWPAREAKLLPALLLLSLPIHLWAATHTNYAEYSQEDTLIARALKTGIPGNVLLFGDTAQVFTALIREHDPDRALFVLRGRQLTASGETVDQMCRKYKIEIVFLEGRDVDQFAPALALDPALALVRQDTYVKDGVRRPVSFYRYQGPVDAEMAAVPLNRKPAAPGS